MRNGMKKIKALVTENVKKDSALLYAYLLLALVAALIIAGVIGVFTGDYMGFIIVGGSILCVAFGVSFAFGTKWLSDRAVEYLYKE